MITVVYRKWYDTRRVPGFREKYASDVTDVSENDPDVETIWDVGSSHNPDGYRIEYTNGTEYIIPQSQVLAIIDDGEGDD